MLNRSDFKVYFLAPLIACENRGVTRNFLNKEYESVTSRRILGAKIATRMTRLRIGFIPYDCSYLSSKCPCHSLIVFFSPKSSFFCFFLSIKISTCILLFFPSEYRVFPFSAKYLCFLSLSHLLSGHAEYLWIWNIKMRAAEEYWRRRLRLEWLAYGLALFFTTAHISRLNSHVPCWLFFLPNASFFCFFYKISSFYCFLLFFFPEISIIFFFCQISLFLSLPYFDSGHAEFWSSHLISSCRFFFVAKWDLFRSATYIRSILLSREMLLKIVGYSTCRLRHSAAKLHLAFFLDKGSGQGWL